MSFQFAKDRFNAAQFLVNTLNQGCAKVLGLGLEQLVLDNHRLTGKTAYSINNMGYYAMPMYVFPLNMVPKALDLGPLHSSLVARHGEWAARYEGFQHSGKRASQTLLSLLGKAQSFQDLRDMLPDTVCRVFPADHPIQLLTRSRPDLYACGLEDGVPGHWDPKMVSSYAAISPLVDAYVGYNLL